MLPFVTGPMHVAPQETHVEKEEVAGQEPVTLGLRARDPISADKHPRSKMPPLSSPLENSKSFFKTSRLLVVPSTYSSIFSALARSRG